jgi:hypothetical protein
MKEIKKLEKFFLLTLLRISIAGASIILITDVILYPQDTLSLKIDVIILSACIVAYFIRNKYFTVSALIISLTTLIAMFYQSLMVPLNTTTSFAIILIVGFIFSILLKGPLQWTMHGLTGIGIVAIFIIQTLNPSLRFSQDTSEIATVGITYCVLYFVISYCTGVLKHGYDRVHEYLHAANIHLMEKTKEIEAQNEELIQIQDNLNELNTNLEKTVNERTTKVQVQNELLLKYSYTNAHHLRGPVARLLGLVAICRLDPNPDFNFFLDKIEQQSIEIDEVVKQINSDLTISKFN